MSENANDQHDALLQPKWPFEDGLEPLYANQFSIARTPHEVVLVFGEFIPTGFSRRSSEEINDFLETALVRPLSKIIMSPAGAKALMTIMTDSLKDLVVEEVEKRKDE
jgi:hypothetical protein